MWDMATGKFIADLLGLRERLENAQTQTDKE